MTEDAQARRFVVRGRVQGVGFRWFVEREAHLLGVYGWVRNNADGSVEVLAQGTHDQLLGLRSRLRQGLRPGRLKQLIREVPDFPKKGILFYDITTLLKDKRGFATLIDQFSEHYIPHHVDLVLGMEARGFIF